MNRECESIRERIVELGVETVRADETDRAHLDGCEGCRGFVATLAEVDGGLAELPAPDAPDDVVGQALDAAAVNLRPAGPEPPLREEDGAEPPRRRTVWWLERRKPRRRADDHVPRVPRPRRWVALLLLGVPSATLVVLVASHRPLQSVRRAVVEGGSGPADTTGAEREQRFSSARSTPSPPPSSPFNGKQRAAPESRDELAQELVADGAIARARRLAERQRRLGKPGSGLGEREIVGRAGRLQSVAERDDRPRRKDEEVAEVRRQVVPDAPAAVPVVTDVELETAPVRNYGAAAVRFTPAMPPPRQANQLLAARARTTGVEFQEANGYWANTYVPGDPVVRLLEQRLHARRSDDAVPAELRTVSLTSALRPVRQPFDPPRDAALALYLHADATAAPGPTRLLVQVGLQATTRTGGLRPDVNLAVVLDLRAPVPLELAQAMRALVAALDDARQTGDRFTLVVAGPTEPEIVPPEEFRHGPLAVALAAALDPERSYAPDGPRLVYAVDAALAAVATGDDPTAPIGASTVLVVTPSRLGARVDLLEERALASSMGGIPLSVVGVGAGVDLDELDRLALAGQGQRRLLTSAEEAAGLVDRELAATSRAVARALRLHVQLAPGVRLVDVLGSERLDAAGAGQVRAVERSLDRRLARNLGLAADRGADDAGIQIVVPAFYAGDAHVVLLDVVADGPGPIAEATLRYKDLAFLRNGTARAALALGAVPSPPGPLERNVLKNFVARRVAEWVREAGLEMEDGWPEGAVAYLEYSISLLRGLQQLVPGWADDPEIAHDLRVLESYLAAARRVPEESPTTSWVAYSLQVAGFHKLQETEP